MFEILNSSRSSDGTMLESATVVILFSHGARHEDNSSPGHLRVETD